VLGAFRSAAEELSVLVVGSAVRAVGFHPAVLRCGRAVFSVNGPSDAELPLFIATVGGIYGLWRSAST
jgi:hypothetical protein